MIYFKMSIFAICQKSHSSQIFRLEQMFYSQNHLLKKIVLWGLSFQSPLNYSSFPKLSTCKLNTLALQIPVGSLGWPRVLGVRELDQTRGGKDGQRWGCQKQTHLCMIFVAVALALKSGSPWFQQQEPLL